jgi:undecaprenyl diphosphate synthase
MSKATTTNVPAHVGLILDGNRRWARGRGLPTLEGHRRGYENLKTIAELAFDKGIKYLSAYTFSTENWNRQKEEVKYLMDLILKMLTRDLKEIHQKGIRIVWLGSTEKLSKKLVQALNKAMEITKNNNQGTLALCFNYGGQLEIAEAVQKIIAKGIKVDDITEQTVADNLYCPEIPPVDIIVRTSGEKRLSNFMLWRSAYSELMFIDKHWPDFNEADLDNVINAYANRQRRFGA